MGTSSNTSNANRELLAVARSLVQGETHRAGDAHLFGCVDNAAGGQALLQEQRDSEQAICT